MYISKNWLKNYLPEIDGVDDELIARKLTLSLAEVEGVERKGLLLKDLVVGEVEKVEKHPQSSKLHVCQVKTGKEESRQIVCGAPNVEPGQKVVVCLPGGSVVNAKTGEAYPIAPSEIKGVASNGMICSERELGISSEHETILTLDGSYTAGEEFDAVLRDSVFEIENKSLTHRGDCFSHKGIARELSAILDLDLNRTEEIAEPVQTESLPLELRIETKKCLKFTAITLKNVKVAPSPFWLKNALGRIGVRSVNNVVDITNYVMFATGQPLHAYDYSKIANHTLIVRETRMGEPLEAIDHKTYTLNDGDIIVGDTREIHDLAGIMGSVSSEINADTTEIILEAAVFSPDQILSTSRHQGLRSEAATRFSKGLDIEQTLPSLKLAVNLINDLAHGDVASEILNVGPEQAEEKFIEFDLQEVPRKVGINIDAESMLVYLERLGIKIENKNNINTSSNIVTVPQIARLRIPSWRKDLVESVDIVEEIIRIHGYDLIETKLPARTTAAAKLPIIGYLQRKVSSQLLNLGFNEVKTYSFISEKLKTAFRLKDRQLLKIMNAISPELNYVRNSLAPSLVETFQKNSNNFDEINIFEIGRTANIYDYDEQKLPRQDWFVGILSNSSETEVEASKKAYLGFKGRVEALLELLGISSTSWSWQEYKSQDYVFLSEAVHPNRVSSLVINGEFVGVVAEVSPYVTADLAIAQKLFIAEINLNKLLDLDVVDTREFQNISPYPSVERDLSFWLNEKVKLAELLEITKSTFAADKSLRPEVQLIDEYFNADGRRSITLNLHLQPLNATLTDAKANEYLKQLKEALVQKFSIVARD